MIIDNYCISLLPCAILLYTDVGVKRYFDPCKMRLDTTRVDINEENDKIEISIDYGLDMNYSHVSDCTINMIIESLD